MWSSHDHDNIHQRNLSTGIPRANFNFALWLEVERIDTKNKIGTKINLHV